MDFRIVFFLLFLPILCIQVEAQTLTPIAVTGYNEDIVAETGSSALINTSKEMDAVPISNFVLCTKSFADENSFTPADSYGLPDDGIFSTSTRSYQMAPYNEGNALYLFSNDSGRLNLNFPSRYTNLSLLTLATEGNAQIRVFFHFSDGSIQVENRNVLDWFGPVTTPDFFGYGRVKRKDGPFINGADYEAAPSGNPKFSEINFTLPCTKTLTGIGFRNTSASGGGSFRAFILAVSGLEKKVIPKITITASDTVVCQGTKITCKALPDSQGTAPIYVWKISTAQVGTNDTLFSSTTLLNQEVITCTMTSSSVCASPSTVVSNSIRITILPRLTPEASIIVNDSSVCAGIPVHFTATTKKAGNPPNFSWRLNGQISGEDSSGFTLNNPKNGDKVFCLVFSTERCKTQNSVRSETKIIEVIPVYSPIIQAPDTLLLDDSAITISVSPAGGILSGQGIVNTTFNPSVAGTGSQTITYSFPENECTLPVSKTIFVKEEIFPCSLEPTNLITANGDNQNDVWEVGDFNKKCIQKVRVEVYNRWGVSVYKSDDYKNDWTGTKEGKELQPGCYFFTVVYSTAAQGNKVVKSGVLSLVR